MNSWLYLIKFENNRKSVLNLAANAIEIFSSGVPSGKLKITTYSFFQRALVAMITLPNCTVVDVVAVYPKITVITINGQVAQGANGISILNGQYDLHP